MACSTCSKSIGARRGPGRAITTCKVVVSSTGLCLDDGLGRCRVFSSPVAAKVAATDEGLAPGAYSVVAVRVL